MAKASRDNAGVPIWFPMPPKGARSLLTKGLQNRVLIAPDATQIDRQPQDRLIRIRSHTAPARSIGAAGGAKVRGFAYFASQDAFAAIEPPPSLYLPTEIN